MGRSRRRVVGVGLVGGAVMLGLAGCGERVAVVRTGTGDAEANWAAALGRVVTRDGLADPHVLSDESLVLQDYVAWLADQGPDSGEWREAEEDRRMAFMANAHNACFLWATLHTGGLERCSAPGGCDELFTDLRFRVDGEWWTLDDLAEEGLMGRYQEPLAMVMIHRGAPRGPRLRHWPSKGLQVQLEADFQSWLAGGGLQDERGDWAIHPWLAAHRRDVALASGQPLCSWLVPFAPPGAHAWLAAASDPACR